MVQQSAKSRNHKIDSIEITPDNMTNRAGLAFFVKYILGIGLFPILERCFGSLKKNKKGFTIFEIFKQVICFFADRTKHHIAWFDELKTDPGYAATIETAPEDMCSRDQVKRFFRSFSLAKVFLFRWLLRWLFIWRLRLNRPEHIFIGIDTMVEDNDDALKREGVEPTYKKKKGFQPLHFLWARKIIDVVFRGGSKHGNHGRTVQNTITKLVNKIRSEYRKDVMIIFVFDSGFFDEKIFDHIDSLNAYYMGSGKKYQFLKDELTPRPDEEFSTYVRDKQIWKYTELDYKCGTWEKARRAIYTVPVSDENGQIQLNFGHEERVIITNIEEGEISAADTIIDCFHKCRGNDELTQRKVKDFGSEKLPFKRFTHNAAFYNLLVVSFFLFQCFNEDAASKAVPGLKVSGYATTTRRQVFDFAGKIVRTSGKVILKVTQAMFDLLNLQRLWELSIHPPELPMLA